MYYYQLFNKSEQAVYHALLTGLQNLAPVIPVPMLCKQGTVDAQRIADIFFCLRLDHPEIFYAGHFRFRYYQNASTVEIIPEYLFEKKKILEHQRAMKSRVEKLARQAQKLSVRDKLLYIHDFICQSVHYDKLKKEYSHEIIGPLGQGVGVCEGIAKAVKILCDALGIWCVIAICGNNPEKGIKYRHTWNIVKVDGKYYHLDVTFDNTLSRSDIIRYDYFMLSDKQIFRDHEPLLWRMPVCEDGDHFYYKEAKRSFTKLEDVNKRSAQAAKKGIPLLFHWRGGYLTRSMLKEILQLIDAEAEKRGKHASVSLNWAQAVLLVYFDTDLASSVLTAEQANEGEEADLSAAYEPTESAENPELGNK